MNNNYKEKFIECDSLNTLQEDFSQFQKHIELSKNKYVTSFSNISGLGVPYFHLRLDKNPKYYKTKKFL
jgi:hypothetical protein